MLEAAGVTATEEKVYRAVLAAPHVSVRAIVDGSGLAPAHVRAALRGLEEKGLVTRTSSSRPTFVATRPDIAIESLIHRRSQELERVRVTAQDLLDQFQRSVERGRTTEVVEVAHSQEAFVHRYLQMRTSASEQWLALDTPPYVTPPNDCDTAAEGQLQRGIEIRAIYDRTVLGRPARLEQIHDAVSKGAEARVMNDLPLKLAIADGKYACLPLSLDAGQEAAIFVFASPLLDALRGFFEMLWERAAPVDSPTAIGPGVADLTDEERNLLAFLAAGLKDEVIARQLGIGGRTVSRKVAVLMDKLGAETRFQAALQAARRGWL